MSAMLAVLKLYYVRQDTYIEAMLALQQAQVGQRKMRKRVRQHRKAFSDAQAEIQNYHTALQARCNQVENAVFLYFTKYYFKSLLWVLLSALLYL